MTSSASSRRSSKESETNTDTFSERFEYTTKALVVEEQRLWISPQYLAECSPYFCALFYQDFKERDQEEVELGEETYEEMLELLRCLVPRPVINSVTDENVASLIMLAEKFQIYHLKIQCIPILIGKWAVDPRKSMEALKIGIKLCCDDLVNACLPLAMSNSNLMKDPFFQQNIPSGLMSAMWEKLVMLQHSTPTNTGVHTASICGSCRGTLRNTVTHLCKYCQNVFCANCNLNHLKRNHSTQIEACGGNCGLSAPEGGWFGNKARN